MIIKKYIIATATAATILAGAVSLALADDLITPKTASTRMGPEMVLQVGPNGRTLLRGTIKTIGTNMLTVTSWGGDWIINISTETKLMPENSMSQFKTGDYVGVQGSIKPENSTWTVDATLVRDWTAKKAIQENKKIMRTERHNNEQEIREVIKDESPRNWQGTANNINAADMSLTLTIDGVAHTVKIVADAKIVSKSFLTASFADIKDGHTVRVWGPVEGTVINAYVVRDISILP